MEIFNPIESFPYRQPIDMVEQMKKYIENKIVCDLGCGGADLLEYMRIKKYCSQVYGIEKDKERYNKAILKQRNYVILDDLLECNIPYADVYLVWLGNIFPYHVLLRKIYQTNFNAIVIYTDSSENNHEKFMIENKVELVIKIEYNYDENKYCSDNIKKFNNVKKRLNANWELIGCRFFKIYKIKFNILEKYPLRQPLDIIIYMKKYIENKVVCDLGCGAGDLLEYIRINNITNKVHGIEINTKRYEKTQEDYRTYIKKNNLLTMKKLIFADVYLIWLGKTFEYHILLNKIKEINENCYIIYMEDNQDYYGNFLEYNNINLVEKIEYFYDETENTNDEELEIYRINTKRDWKVKGKSSFLVCNFIKK